MIAFYYSNNFWWDCLYYPLQGVWCLANGLGEPRFSQKEVQEVWKTMASLTVMDTWKLKHGLPSFFQEKMGEETRSRLAWKRA